MTERRQHWDDELIGEVGNAIADTPTYDWQAGTVRDAGALLDDYIGHIYAVIAVVEDWHKAKRDSRDRTHSDECWRWHRECAEALIEAQQARLDKLSAQLMWYPDYQAAEAALRRVREIHRIVSPHWRPKTLREKLCQQEWSAPDDETREAIARLIATLDRHRPLGSDGKHGDLHTATCGCELDGVMRCQHCGHDYPCPTIRALDGDGDE